jgi:hypothetical protein
LPGGGATVIRRALLEESSPGLGFVVGEAVRWPLRVVYADHSRLEHYGVAAGGIAIALIGELELVCRGFRSSNVWSFLRGGASAHPRV